MTDHLLPINATPSEIAQAQTVARLSDVPIPVRAVYRPQECPAALLPWLAWAFSVDEWNPEWTDQQKRDAIVASAYVHRHKGTVGAMKRALEAFGFETDLIEWPAGDPYTFSIQIDVESSPGPASASDYDEAERIALSAKNVRSHLTGINAAGKTSGIFYTGGVAINGETVTVQEDTDGPDGDYSIFLEAQANGYEQTELAVDNLHTMLHATMPAPGYW